jgi:trans-aconitate methyltransferase
MNSVDALSLIRNDEIAGNNNSTRWADLGCGSGLFTRALGSMLSKGSIIYGVDSNTTMKRQITANGIEIIPMHSDFVKDELGLQELDGVIMANSFHYVKDKDAFIKKVKTWLNPGSLLLIVEYDTEIPVPGWVPFPVSFKLLYEIVKIAGFGPARKLGERPSVYGRSNLYSALIENRMRG